MLKRRLMYILTIILAVIIAFPSGSSGQVDEKLRDDCAAVLVRLKIMQGGTGGNLRLDDPITRSEFVTLVIRMMGWDYDTELDGIGLAFSDSGQIQGWAENYIKIALKYNLIKGYIIKGCNTGNTVTSSQQGRYHCGGAGNIDKGAWVREHGRGRLARRCHE